MDLPVEVIQHIIYFLSPCEIVKLRQVARQFQEITRSPALWRAVYSNARLLLPPGPFPSQSTQYLERTLVQSEIVSKTWTSQPVKVLRSTEISWKRQTLGEGCTVAFGRWCIFLDAKVIQCHDIDTDTRRFLYDGAAHPPFSFTACATAHTGDQWVYLLLVGQQSHPLTRLLGFRIGKDDLLGPEIMDWTHVRSRLSGDWRLASFHDCRVSTPFLVVCHNDPRVVVDLRTRRLYSLLVPESFRIELANRMGIPVSLANLLDISAHVIPTKTHVIVFWVHDYFTASVFLIQALVIPDLATPGDRDDIGELCLTHEVEFTHNHHRTFTLLRNSVVDPITGSVNIRVLHTTLGIRMSNFCLDFSLPDPGSTTDVLPISLRSRHLFDSSWLSELYTASDDGHARGVLVEYFLPLFRLRKFTIDASQDECILEISDPCPRDSSWEQVSFCGTRGRIHVFKQNVDPGSRITVRTIDLA